MVSSIISVDNYRGSPYFSSCDTLWAANTAGLMTIGLCAGDRSSDAKGSTGDDGCGDSLCCIVLIVGFVVLLATILG